MLFLETTIGCNQTQLKKRKIFYLSKYISKYQQKIHSCFLSCIFLTFFLRVVNAFLEPIVHSHKNEPRKKLKYGILNLLISLVIMFIVKDYFCSDDCV